MKVLILGTFFYVVLWSSILAGCGANAGGYRHAEVVPGPSGVTCYAIVDEDNRVVGGNCQ